MSQGEVLAERLLADGYTILSTSTSPGRWRRLADILTSLLLWRSRYDVVILMVFSGPAFWISRIASLLARALRKPVVLWLHGGNLPSYLQERPHAVRLLARGAHVVAPSSYLTHQIPPGTARSIIPNLLPREDIEFVVRSQVQPRVLWMRTFHPIYRPDLALRAFALLRARHPEAVLTMAGQNRGWLAGSSRLAAELGIEQAVSFPGFADEQAKAKLFRDHDLFLNTSVTDNFPVSLVEAAAAGLLIVSSNVGGIPDLFTDHENALLVSDPTPTRLVAAMEELIDRPDLASHLSSAGRRRAEECTWAEAGPEWRQVLSEVCATGVESLS